jgi:hypothetical protein
MDPNSIVERGCAWLEANDASIQEVAVDTVNDVGIEAILWTYIALVMFLHDFMPPVYTTWAEMMAKQKMESAIDWGAITAS